MSNFTIKYSAYPDSDEDIPGNSHDVKPFEVPIHRGSMLDQRQRDYDSALQERAEIEREIQSLCSKGIPNMGFGKRGEYVPSNTQFGQFQGETGKAPPQRYQLSVPPPTRTAPVYAQAKLPSDYYNAPAQAANNPYYDANRGPKNKPKTPQSGKPIPPGPDAMPTIKVRGFGRSIPLPSNQAIVYQVHFKRNAKYYVPGPRSPPLLAVGEFVITQCTRGENLGVVTECLTMQQLQLRRYEAKMAGIEPEEGEGNLSQIIRVAHRYEKQALPAKFHDEELALELARDLANHKYGLQMVVVDCEYQFDRERLTVFYACESRVDFRDLLKELCATLKIRIWMKQIVNPGPFAINSIAAQALATGVFTAA